MSVTFWVIDGPVEKISQPCLCDELGGGAVCSCNGSGRYDAVIPKDSLNVSNATARALLRSLGVNKEDLSGSWAADELPAIRRRIIELLNKPQALAPFVVEGHVDDFLVDFGVSDERLTDRLTRLLDVIAAAQRLSTEVVWG
jgi:hypothetical protein